MNPMIGTIPTLKPERQSEMLTEAQNVNILRAAIYGFLSRGFIREIDESYLEKMATMEPTIGMLSNSQGDQELKEGSKRLFEFMKKIEALRPDERRPLLVDLAAEYASLFLGVGPKRVHLVESVYLGRDHLLYEKPYHEVVEAYRSLGFEKEKAFTEPEDHVAVEFEFMARLCRWASQTLQKSDVANAIAYLNLQKEFLKDHITSWVPDLCRKLDEAANSDFYKGLAHLTQGFIRIDDEMPDQLTEMLKEELSAK
jgi:TorA maturation chaperone TorD